MLPRLLALSLACLSLASEARRDLHRFEAVEPHMGTLVRITAYAPGEQSARDGFRAAFDRIGDLEAILSDYRPDSELSQVTRRAVRSAVTVSEDLFKVLLASQELAEATGGAFDITQGPVVRLWREARATRRAPNPAALRAAAERSGFRKLHLDATTSAVRFDRGGMMLDVGAIGKGYAASEALEVLRGHGLRSALVAVSGDLAFGDAPPGHPGWRIGVHSEDPSLLGVPGVLVLTNAAVSTSGADEQHVEIDGRRYSHIIDPASSTGLTADITVTVVAPDGLQADGLDTAVSVLGPRRGFDLVDARPGTAALVVQRTSTGTIALTSSRFQALAEHQSGMR